MEKELLNASPTNLLFVCVENSCRSQMAEGFARRHANVRAYSAGSKPSGVVNPKAIESMAEVGVDLSAHRSKSLDEFSDVGFAHVVTMGCGDACPWIAAGQRHDWAIPDPKDMEPGDFAKVRDLIETKVKNLLGA